jgi:hypothetical protein
MDRCVCVCLRSYVLGDQWMYGSMCVCVGGMDVKRQSLCESCCKTQIYTYTYT